MIIENLLAQVNELQAELRAVKQNLANVEEIVASLRVQTTTGVKNVTEQKATSATVTAKMASK